MLSLQAFILHLCRSQGELKKDAPKRVTTDLKYCMNTVRECPHYKNYLPSIGAFLNGNKTWSRLLSETILPQVHGGVFLDTQGGHFKLLCENQFFKSS